MKAYVLTVGNEILAGDIHDTNFREISELLRDAGIRIRRHESVPDEVDAIRDAVRGALAAETETYDLVLLTGGLGPTPDDLTREGVAAALNLPQESQDDLARELRRRFEAAGYGPIPENNFRQVNLPRGARGLPNPAGSAPGFALQAGDTWVVAVPGVPQEMRLMVREQVVPLVQGGEAPVHDVRRVRTQGIGESSLSERIEGLLGDLAVEVGFYPKNPGVDIKLTASGENRSRVLDEAEARLRERLHPAVYATGDQTLSARVGELLRERGWRLAVAESCTGGLLTAFLVETPGASDYVACGVVAYSNQAKTDFLGVPAALIQEHGAVSAEVARAMASGVRERSGADWAVATTGVAGPGGGTEEKPVGLVHVAVAGPQGVQDWVHRSHGDRAAVIRRTAVGALNRVRLTLEDVGDPSS